MTLPRFLNARQVAAMPPPEFDEKRNCDRCVVCEGTDISAVDGGCMDEVKHAADCAWLLARKLTGEP